MKAKKLFAVALAAMLVATSSLAVGAVESKSTGNVYMNGYVLYGKVTVYPIHAEGYTYCEKASAGKMANTRFAYYDKDELIRECAIATTDYVYNGEVGLSMTTPSASTSYFNYYAGAMTDSRVIFPDQTYYHWTSEDTFNELRLGFYARD